jgi:hypothetical protein
MARLSRCGPARGGVGADVVDADVVYANEDTADSIKLKLEGVDNVEDGIGRSTF